MNKLLLLSLLFAVSETSFAELNIPGIPETSINLLVSTDKTLAQTGISSNEDDMVLTSESLVLTDSQKHEAKVWGLTEEEEKRYVALMQNRSAVYYQGLRQTPIDILGINARSEAERNRFAAIAAEQEAQKVAKNIAWNNAFYKAYNQLFKNVPVVGAFDASPYSPAAYKPLALNANDHLYFFIKPGDAVQTVLLMLIDAINSTANTELHILLLDADDTAIQLWANQHQLPRALVDASRISLHHGEMNLKALSVDKKTPLLLLARNGTSRIVDLGKF